MSPILINALIAASLLTVVLAAYALRLWRQVWARQAQLRAREQAFLNKLRDDLQVLAQALIDEQVPLIEGAIRIKVLLDNFDPTLAQTSPCQVFDTLYQATADIPTHAGWKALSNSQRREYEARFESLQQQHGSQAQQAAHWLLDDGLRRQTAAH